MNLWMKFLRIKEFQKKAIKVTELKLSNKPDFIDSSIEQLSKCQIGFQQGDNSSKIKRAKQRWIFLQYFGYIGFVVWVEIL